jgi:FMN reductase
VRAGSSTEKALRHVLAAAERGGARTFLISGESLRLPLYAPEETERSETARIMIAELAKADGIILASPGYHGTLSGVIKNALDYTEDLRADPRPYFAERPVGCVATGGGWQGAVHTLGALRNIVHALRGWPTPMGAAINSSEGVFDADGVCLMPRVAETLDQIAAEVLGFVGMHGPQSYSGRPT